ncbi:TetR/AcrR family transcriptional regulator [Sphingobium sp. HBC34]|uniref:TetR/AcrR family transcriptional regulator n=1 Tax=Sphingobium cyanobacteriorum TaxID=3063954 RepID=A0ABT8ZKF2_9SPHN|nr:TetR/AcrR family transcriptional regulator [Sphingobium sp. HBC34]MDO7835017.1 TetR/AcrR family transcriptional regulator [Sphingobium sp. HBC34]
MSDHSQKATRIPAPCRPDDRQHVAPRKMPRQARAAATVQAIVEAAARILEQDGLAGFTTNAVADRAGVSIGSLYQYFPGKDALVGALIIRETSRLIDEVEGACARADGVAALSGLIDAAVAHQLRRPALARLLDFAERRLSFDPDSRRVTDRLEAMLRDILGRADLPRQEDAGIAAQDVFAIVKAMVDTAGDREEQDCAALRVRVNRAVFGYLRAGGGAGLSDRDDAIAPRRADRHADDAEPGRRPQQAE